MEHTKINRLTAFAVFLISLVTYIFTLADTVVFWDVGEFIAAAYLLQVPHPPGSPFFLLVGKIFGMIPFAKDPAVRIHFISALTSALTAMFLYLTIIKAILIWKEKPNELFDKITLYGAGIIGALSLTFSVTFWFNAVEAEVYGISMLFVSSIIYLTLRWNERAEKPGNEKYLLLIAYLVGLSIGVHLLALLTIFPLLMIIYFRHYAVTQKSLLVFAIVAVCIFAIVYPGIVQMFPNFLDGEMTIGGQVNESIIWTLIPIAIIVAAIYGVYYSHVHKKGVLNVACISFLLIILGYSTYTMVIIRSNARPPMNENTPDNLKGLVSYLNREQYGDAPHWPRRHSQEPQHRPTWENYSSDMDFMWRYQTYHMFIRYLLWQYVGIEGDWQDAGVNWKQLYGIPFLLGLFGAFYHYKKDKKTFYAFLVMFVMMGVILALQQRQQDPQPRERDYFYVGAFFVFSAWIGIGLLGLIQYIREFLKTNEDAKKIATVSVLVLSIVLVPFNMARTNYKGSDRTGDYMAWDYSYNLLQSCEPDAILFTNGDNDTFPLWYLQDVEGVRRDIRIVNLSLVNTSWYILQLKNETPHGAKKVPISLSDDQIKRLQPIQWEPKEMTLEIPNDVMQQYGISDAPKQNNFKDSAKNKTGEVKGEIKFVFPNTMTVGNIKAIRVQDIMTYDIINTNKWKRPIYFAVTSSTDTKIGLERYFRMDGLAMKLIPFQTPDEGGIITDNILATNLYNSPKEPSKEFQRGYLYRGLRDTTVYYNENVTRLTMNYRNAFLRLALHHLNKNSKKVAALDSIRNNVKAIEALDSMEAKVPAKVFPLDYRLMFDIMKFYNIAGATEQYKKYRDELEGKLLALVKDNGVPPLTQSNPYTMLLTLYDEEGSYQKAIDILNAMNTKYGTMPEYRGIDQQIKMRIAQIQTKMNVKDSATMMK